MKLADLIQDIPLIESGSQALTQEITGLTEDSRRIEPGMLFAALPGTQADGMAFAESAVQRGAVAILAGANADAAGLSVPILRAGEPRQALARLAARFYGAQPEIVAAVTGTNGKTSVTAFLREIWAETGLPAASLGTVGIVSPKGETPLAHTTPDPVSLHKHLARLAGEGVTHLALEASSHGLDQHRLDGVRIAAGAFTNVTRDHLDYHPTFEHYLNAKLRLFREMLAPGAPAVIDADSPGADAVTEAARAAKLDVLTVGHGGDGIALEGIERQGFKQRLFLTCDGHAYSVDLPLAGAFQVSNALVAAGLALGLGARVDEVFAALSKLQGAKGRLEYIGETPEGAPIFVDYAHTPDALVKALEALKPYVTGQAACRVRLRRRPRQGQAAANGRVAHRLTPASRHRHRRQPRSEDPATIRAEIRARPRSRRDREPGGGHFRRRVRAEHGRLAGALARKRP